jgi:hypothetical protein
MLLALLAHEGITSGEVWGRQYAIVRSAGDPSGLLSAAELDRMLETSLLRWPYFSVLRSGAAPHVGTYTVTRNVIGHGRDGFIDAAAVRGYLRAGGTLKLNRMSDWHRPSRDIRRALESALPVAVSCYAFWTPPERSGMLPHRDASHVLVIQVEGRKKWRLYASDEQIRSTPGLDVESSVPTHEFVLEPGDLLYLPHGWPHDAQTVGDVSSLHLTFTMAEATPEALMEGLQAVFTAADSELTRQFHKFDLADRADRVQAELVRLAASLSDEEWLGEALSVLRKQAG